MRTQARWLQSAAAMAFLAVVALFVSPVLALHCCCDDAPACQLSVNAPKAQTAHCHDESAAKSTASHQAASVARCAAVRANCECDSALSNAKFVAADSARFFAPVAVALPAQIPSHSFVVDARRATYAHFAARPRAPDRNHGSSRAPPALVWS